MPKVALDIQSETTRALVYTYGCLLRKHVISICGGDEDKARRIISFLIKYGAIRTSDDENILKPHVVSQQKLDKGTLDCLTVAIDMVQDEDGIYLDALRYSFGNPPAKVGLITKDNTYVNIIPVNETSISSTLSFITEKFKKGHKPDDKGEGLLYVFVIHDKTMLQKIGVSGIVLPHKIALITAENGEENIKYFTPKS